MSGRARALAGLAVVVAGTLAAGSGYALHEATDDTVGATTSAASTPLPSDAPTPEPSETPTASPTPAPVVTARPTTTPTPSVTPSPSASASASPTASPRATPTVRYYPYPSPTTSYASLYFQSAKVTPEDSGTLTVDLEARAVDGDGTIFVTAIDWGDGHTDGGEPDPSGCPAYPSPTSNPGPYKPQPDDRIIATSHHYATAGTYTVAIRVRSINADCRPRGPAHETAVATLRGVGVS